MPDGKESEALRAITFRRESLGADTPTWPRTTTETVADCRVFRVRRDWRINPRDATEHDFYVIEASDWINVIPVTEAGDVVMVEQYRHGTDEVTLEIPGGILDPGETPEAAASRELLEETGYAANQLVLLGRSRPNPATHNNWIYTYLADRVSAIRAPVFEGTEHTAVRLVPIADVPVLVADGTINHSLIISGFYLHSLYREGVMSRETAAEAPL